MLVIISKESLTTFLFKQGKPQNTIQIEMTTIKTFKQCNGGHLQVIIDLNSTTTDLTTSLEGLVVTYRPY